MLVITKKKKFLNPNSFNNNKKTNPKSPPPQQTIFGCIKTADVQFAPKDTQADSYMFPEEQV